MNDMLVLLERWQLDVSQVRERVYQAPTPRERERWHALWLLARGWSAVQVAEALGRDAHTIGEWAEHFGQQGPAGLAFEQSGGSPPPSTRRNRRS
jgi:transposase